MSKKNAIILILIVFLVILGLLLFFYFYNGQKQATTPITEGTTTSNPFGNNVTNKTSSTTENKSGYNYTGENKKVAVLRQLYSYPNSGSVILEKNGVTSIRFVDRATGNVEETASDSEEIKRLTNTTVPKILEAVWSSTGNSLILRYSVNDPEKIDNFSAKIKTSSSTSNEFTGEITGRVVSQNADSIITNPSGNKTFSVIKRGNLSGSYGLISALDGAGSKQIFDSEISEWLTSWPKDNTISFVTKPSYKQYGYLFFLNTDTGAFEKILGNIYGMNVLVNKNISSFVYSNSSRSSVRLAYYDIKTTTDKNLQINTLADKCVWSNKDNNIVYCAVPKYIPNNNYPDAWYQGTVSFSDNFWKIDVEKGTTDLIYETGINDSVSIDAINLEISNDDSYIVFTDKNDLSLWGLQVTK
jgi:uncharacterized protein YxeA